MQTKYEVNSFETIVSATNKEGKIIYANDTFCKIAGYALNEVIGKPHNIIRHKDMPKVIFKLLWRTALSGNAIYAFVKNRTKDGGYYFVKAFVKPIMEKGELVQIVSYRRRTNEYAQSFIESFYKELVSIEKDKDIDSSLQYLEEYLKRRNLTYQNFIDRLSQGYSVENERLLSFEYLEHKIEHIILNEQLKSSHTNENHQELERSCRFEKWLLEVRDEPFTQSEDFKSIVKRHSELHSIMNAKNDSVSNTFAQKNDEFFASLNTFINKTQGVI